MPGLVPDGTMSPPAPKSVLLLLAGTGVVALPQVLAHRDPARKLGISTPRRQTLHNVSVDLLLSCRSDDVLMLDEIAQWCREGATSAASSSSSSWSASADSSSSA